MFTYTITGNALPAGRLGDYSSTIRVQIGAAGFGAGPPATDYGQIGELYIDENSGVIYKKTGSTTWEQTVAPEDLKTIATTSTPTGGMGSVGDIAIVYDGGLATELYEKTGTTTWTKRADFGGAAVASTAVVSFMDDFLSVSESGAWVFTTKAGTGALRAAAANTDTTACGVAELVSQAATAAYVAIAFPKNSATAQGPFTKPVLQARRVEASIRFKLATADDMIFGFTHPPAGASVSFYNLLGIRGRAGQTYFELCAVKAGTGTIANSTVAVDTAWHTARILYDGSAWKMGIDDETLVTVNASPVTNDVTLTLAAWLESDGNVAGSLLIDYIALTGTR